MGKAWILPCVICILTLMTTNTNSKILIKSAIIYDEFYTESMPMFREAVDETNTLQVEMIEFKQAELTHIVETVLAEKVSSLFILSKFVNCTAMVELKQAISIFFIGIMRDHCDPFDFHLLYFFPPHFDVMQAMYDAIEEYKWKTAAVFYDGSEELAFGYQDLDLARLRGINLKVWVIPDNEDETWEVLKSVRLLGYRTYILACDYKVATNILQKAVFLSMVSEVNHWILPNLETHPKLLSDFLESSVRLTLLSAETIRNVLEDSFTNNVPEKQARDNVVKALTKDALNLIYDSCNFTIALDCFSIPLTQDHQCGIDQGAKSKEANQFYSKGTCTDVYMTKLFEIGATKVEYLEHHLGNPKGTLSFVGYWKNFHPEYQAFVQAAVVFPEAPLKIGLVYEPPWMKWHVNELTNEISFEGYFMDLLETLTNQLNFKYEFVYNERVGQNRKNDTVANEEVKRWLENKEVEFVLTKRAIHGQQLGVEELTRGFQQVSYFMVTLASGNEQPVNIWQFLAPFTYDSWAVLWSAMVVISCVLALVNHFNPFEWRKQALDETNDDVPVENFNKLGLGNSIWMAYAGIVHQGVDVEPRSYAGKMITGTWWYFTMLVIAAYTANLTAFLTQELSGEISDLNGLIEATHFSFGTTYDADILDYFLNTATNEPFATIREKIYGDPGVHMFNTTEEILSRISEGGFYYLAPFGEVARIEQESCEYARVGEGFWKYQYGIPFQLGSRYTYVFNDAIGSLRDDGTLQELEEKWFNFRTECKEGSFDIEANRLGIDNLGGMFILLLIGAILAVMVHYGEVAWAARTRFKIFRHREEKKATSDNPVSDMKKRRQQERKELDQQIEDWEGGYQFWINKMDHINKTLETIDDHNRSNIKTIKNGRNDDEENFSWWTSIYQKVNGGVDQMKQAMKDHDKKVERPDSIATTSTSSGIEIELTTSTRSDCEDRVTSEEESSSGIEIELTTSPRSRGEDKISSEEESCYTRMTQLPQVTFQVESPSQSSLISRDTEKSKKQQKIRKMLSFTA